MQNYKVWILSKPNSYAKMFKNIINITKLYYVDRN